MGIGAYRHVVTLEHPAVTLDPATWHCAIQSAALQVVDGVASYFIRGRFHPAINLETVIVMPDAHGPRRFQVQSVQNVDERGQELVLLCAEVVGRGVTPQAGSAGTAA